MYNTDAVRDIVATIRDERIPAAFHAHQIVTLSGWAIETCRKVLNRLVSEGYLFTWMGHPEDAKIARPHRMFYPTDKFDSLQWDARGKRI